MALLLVGLDCEMTGNNVEEYQLCQIGVTTGTTTFVSDVGHHPDSYKTQEKALQVNGFTKERIESGPNMWAVDTRLQQWFEALGAEKRKVIPIGFNVAGFDMPFVRKFLPKASEYISRKTADLNALCYALEGKEYKKSYPKMSGWKRLAKKYAEDKLGRDPKWHDAGYDAEIAMLCYKWLKERIKE